MRSGRGACGLLGSRVWGGGGGRGRLGLVLILVGMDRNLTWCALYKRLISRKTSKVLKRDWKMMFRESIKLNNSDNPLHQGPLHWIFCQANWLRRTSSMSSRPRILKMWLIHVNWIVLSIGTSCGPRPSKNKWRKPGPLVATDLPSPK